ncbi:MAG: alkaline phosphatase D family protein [Solirubrobacterales bacterium]|nr:alkaline phosphatase D family protein [Solirubrobacterales bacterium]
MASPAYSRRTFLGGAAASAAALMAWRDPFALAQSRVPVARGGTFAQGVSSGQQTDSGITLWSRVGGLDRTSRVQFEVSTDPGFAKVIHRQDALAGAEAGFTALQRVEGLAPGTEYYYRCFSCDTTSAVGRFTTTKADSNDPVRIGFFSCQAFEAGFYTPHHGLSREPDLDLVVCLGDYIYERPFYGEEGTRADTTGANGDGEVQTLPEYRDKYALYHTDQRLIDVRQRYPLIAIWDDHEVEDNYAGGLPGDATLDRRIPFADRQAGAYAAFFEHMPRIRVPGDPNRIYGSMKLGKNAELLLLDERQFKSDQPCGDAALQPCAEANDPRAFLGDTQKAWFKDALVTSDAAWKLVGNQVMIMSFDVTVAQNPVTLDSWDGYGAERREIAEFIGGANPTGQPLRDVSFITGDIHTFFAGRVTPSGRQTAGETAVATEFVCGSVTSEGVVDLLSPQQELDAGIGALSEASLLLNNPHLRYIDAARRGYGVIEARSDRLDVSFRSPPTIKDNGVTDIQTIARFSVARGSTDVVVEQVTAGTAAP